MTGVMQGNWDSVWLAYGLTVLGASLYLGTILARLRAFNKGKP